MIKRYRVLARCKTTGTEYIGETKLMSFGEYQNLLDDVFEYKSRSSVTLICEDGPSVTFFEDSIPSFDFGVEILGEASEADRIEWASQSLSISAAELAHLLCAAGLVDSEGEYDADEE